MNETIDINEPEIVHVNEAGDKIIDVEPIQHVTIENIERNIEKLIDNSRSDVETEKNFDFDITSLEEETCKIVGMLQELHNSIKLHSLTIKDDEPVEILLNNILTFIKELEEK